MNRYAFAAAPCIWTIILGLATEASSLAACQTDLKRSVTVVDVPCMRNGEADRWAQWWGEGRLAQRVSIGMSLHCNLGRVLDLSLGGLRVRARKMPKGKAVHVKLWDDAGGFSTEACVVWCIRRGFWRYEVGLQFPPLEDADRAFMQRVAERHRLHHTLTSIDSRGRRAA